MAQANRTPRLALDVVIVVVAVALVLLSLKLGLRPGHPASKGLGATLGGVYIIYLGLLFLLSYFFPQACYVFNVMTYLCQECSRPRGRHNALLACGLAAFFGGWLLLIGVGVL
jgi:hypothetical protein